MQQPSLQSRFVIRFGVFEADLESGELRKNGVRIKIQDLPFRALKLLLSHPNEVVSRDQLRQTLWPEGIFVDFDHGISSAINRLRDALGDSADNPVFVETVDRRGYRWIAPAYLPAPPVAPASPVVKRTDQQASDSATTRSRLWWLALPLAALLLSMWSLKAAYRGAKGSGTTTGTHPAKPDQARTEAEQFYLKGRFYWQKRTPEGLNKALDSFTQSIVHDPGYAPAYVGLADTYNLLREYTLMPASEAYPRALAAAKKAVELDDQSSEAHASLAFALFYGKWDITISEREFRRAIELNANNAVAHHWYATCLAALGRYSEAMAEIERAQTLDPTSKAILADKGDILWVAGQRQASVSLLKQMAAAEPDFISPHRYLAVAYLASGDYPAYLSERRKEAALMHDPATLRLVDIAEKGLKAGGGRGMLQSMLAMQKKMCDDGEISPYLVAQTNSLLGNKEETLRYLKIAYEQHDERFVGIEGDAAFANLHQDPPFQTLVSRLTSPSNTDSVAR
jgi:DNA-binding winged helix-turn-helix (wHTH) protein/Tfp pilus assembly protein PilF